MNEYRQIGWSFIIYLAQFSKNSWNQGGWLGYSAEIRILNCIVTRPVLKKKSQNKGVSYVETRFVMKMSYALFKTISSSFLLTYWGSEI